MSERASEKREERPGTEESMHTQCGGGGRLEGTWSSTPASSQTACCLLPRYLLRFFECLAHPNLSATFATDEKLPLCHLRISYQSLAGSLSSLQKSEFLKLIILIFHVKN